MQIRKLRPDDGVAVFTCGEPDLDRFLKKYAGRNQDELFIGVTYVGVHEGRVLAYCTLAPAQLRASELPEQMSRALPGYPLPVLRLARLAVDQAVQGQGLGRTMLGFALRLALRQADEVGCLGVLVDAKAEAVGFYEGLGFFELGLTRGASDARPQPTAMFLPIEDIRRAAGEA